MVTKPELPIEEDQPAAVQRAARVIVAGDERGMVRRIILYVIVGVALLVGGALVAGIGLAALILLATTDQLV